MNNKIIKYIPLLLVASVIAQIIPVVITDLSLITSYWLLGIATMIFSSTIAFIIFYADSKRNNSVVASIGLFVTAIYVVSSIISLIIARNTSSLSDYNTISNLAKFQATLTAVLEMLRYMSITSLISIENNSNTTNLFKMGAYISAGVYGLLGVISVWSVSSIDLTLPKLLTVTKEVLQIMIYSIILIQVVESGENNSEIESHPVSPTNTQAQFNNMVISNEPTPTFTNTPKFRNPALEEQEARIKAEQMQKAAMAQNNQPQVPGTVTLQQNQNNINGNNQ